MLPVPYTWHMSEYTTALFARPSFLSGAARLLDLGGTFDRYNRSPDAATADLDALRRDALATIADCRRAFELLAEAH